MTTLTDDPTTPSATKPPMSATSLVRVLIGLACVLLVLLIALLVRVRDLQNEVSALANRSAPALAQPRSNSESLDVCRLLGVLAAQSKVSMETLFPASTVSNCEQAATEGYHAVVSPAAR